MNSLQWMVALLLALCIVGLQLLLLRRGQTSTGAAATDAAQDMLIAALARQMLEGSERTERLLRAEVQGSAQGTRQELTANLVQFQHAVGTQLSNQIDSFSQRLAAQNETSAAQLEAMRQAIAAQ
ncbi:MAG: DNA recombination protein RmuC, partial [Janthinobacterium lividum]